MSIPSYAMNHIGISVPDIEAAVVWYRDVLGCFVLVPPGDAAVDGSHFGKVVADIFGEGFANELCQLSVRSIINKRKSLISNCFNKLIL